MTWTLDTLGNLDFGKLGLWVTWTLSDLYFGHFGKLRLCIPCFVIGKPEIFFASARPSIFLAIGEPYIFFTWGQLVELGPYYYYGRLFVRIIRKKIFLYKIIKELNKD